MIGRMTLCQIRLAIDRLMVAETLLKELFGDPCFFAHSMPVVSSIPSFLTRSVALPLDHMSVSVAGSLSAG